MSDSRLDMEVLRDTPWEREEPSDRLRLFELAATSRPSRGEHAGGLGIDVVGLAEVSWPGTEEVFEHPLWECWRDPPCTFSGIVSAVEECLEYLELNRDHSRMANIGRVPAEHGQRERVLQTFRESVLSVSGALGILDQLLLLTVLFREADVLRLSTVAFLMDLLIDSIARFKSSDLGFEETEDIEMGLLFARWEVVMDDPRTIENSLDGLTPIEAQVTRLE